MATGNGVEATRRGLTGLPSTVTDMLCTELIKGSVCSRMNLTVKFSGPCKQFGVLKKKALITGKKRVVRLTHRDQRSLKAGWAITLPRLRFAIRALLRLERSAALIARRDGVES
jgi:hypothetical protein